MYEYRKVYFLNRKQEYIYVYHFRILIVLYIIFNHINIYSYSDSFYLQCISFQTKAHLIKLMSYVEISFITDASYFKIQITML